MSDDLVKRWDDYVESMGCVMGEVEHTAQQMRDRIEELEAKLSKATQVVEMIASADVDAVLGEAVDISCEIIGELMEEEDDE